MKPKSNIEKAIDRLEKQEAACNELIAMAQKDIAELRKRRDNARNILAGFRNLPMDRDDFPDRELIEITAERLANRPVVMISCMGVGIKC